MSLSRRISKFWRSIWCCNVVALLATEYSTALSIYLCQEIFFVVLILRLFLPWHSLLVNLYALCAHLRFLLTLIRIISEAKSVAKHLLDATLATLTLLPTELLFCTLKFFLKTIGYVLKLLDSTLLLVAMTFHLFDVLLKLVFFTKQLFVVLGNFDSKLVVLILDLLLICHQLSFLFSELEALRL